MPVACFFQKNRITCRHMSCVIFLTIYNYLNYHHIMWFLDVNFIALDLFIILISMRFIFSIADGFQSCLFFFSSVKVHLSAATKTLFSISFEISTFNYSTQKFISFLRLFLLFLLFLIITPKCGWMFIFFIVHYTSLYLSVKGEKNRDLRISSEALMACN